MPSDRLPGVIRLRPMLQSDLDRVWNWRNQWRIRRYMFSQTEIAWEDHIAWYDDASGDPRRHLLICEIDGTPFGFVHFSESDYGKISRWGFYTAQSAPGGYGRSLCREALRYGFCDIGLHKIVGEVLGFNQPSRRLHETLGFKLEGVHRDAHYDGADYHDVYHFGLLNTEWSN